MTLDDTFIQAIAEQPDDTNLRLIYSDWLEEQGQTDRAAFIRVQCERAELSPRDPRWWRLFEREDALLERHRERWFAPLRAVLERARAASESRRSLVVRLWRRVFGRRVSAVPPWHQACCVGCSRGFVEGLSLSTTEFLAEAGALFRAAPLLQHIHLFVDAVEGLAPLLCCPHLGRLRILELSDDALGVDAVERLASCPHLGHLQQLTLSSPGLSASSVRALNAGGLLSRLRELTLFTQQPYIWPGGTLEDDAVEELASTAGCRNLAALDLSLGRVSDRGAFALARSPHLLSLSTLALSYNEIGPAGAHALVSSANLGRLTSLDLSGTQLGAAGAEGIASTPGLARLATLRLRSAGIGDSGARLLADSPHVSGLTILDLSDNPIGEEVQRELLARFGERVCL